MDCMCIVFFFRIEMIESFGVILPERAMEVEWEV